MNGLEFLPFVLIPLLFWLLVIRPASRNARRAREMQQALAVGDDVVLTSGFYGTITAVRDDGRLEVELGPGTIVTIDNRAVGAVARPDADGATDTIQTNTNDAEPSLKTDSEES